MGEFSFKEMRTRGQSKISSCCICDWCKSREIGGNRKQGRAGGVVNIPNTNGGKLLSRPLYSCKSHWTDSALELSILLCLIPGARGEHLTSLLSWIAA